MTRTLLDLISRGAPGTTAELAAAAGARHAEVEAALGELARLGYLEDLACAARSGGCAGASLGCGGCAGKRARLDANPAHLWALTAKGRGAAERMFDASAQPQ